MHSLSTCSVHFSSLSIVIPKIFLRLTCVIVDPFICIRRFVRNWLSFPFEAISLNSVLPVFKVNLLAYNQSLTWDRSVFNLRSISAGVFPAQDRFVSSANMEACVYLRHIGRSFIYGENSKGPKLEPCGTPHLTVSCPDLILLITQTCFLLFK